MNPSKPTPVAPGAHGDPSSDLGSLVAGVSGSDAPSGQGFRRGPLNPRLPTHGFDGSGLVVSSPTPKTLQPERMWTL